MENNSHQAELPWCYLKLFFFGGGGVALFVFKNLICKIQDSPFVQ